MMKRGQVVDFVRLQFLQVAFDRSVVQNIHDRAFARWITCYLGTDPAIDGVPPIEKQWHKQTTILARYADNQCGWHSGSAPTISIAGKGKIIFPPRCRNERSRWIRLSRKCHG